MQAQAPRRGRHPALRVVAREWHVYRRLWRASVASTFLEPLLYLSALGLGLGSLVDRSGGGADLGVSYVAFIAPAILVAGAMQTAAGDSTFGVMAGIKWLRFFHGALASPIRVVDLVTGHLLWVLIRAVMSVLAFAIVIALLGVVPPLRALAATGPALLTAMAFAGPLSAWSATIVRESGQFPALFRFVIIPMFLFAGVFFPITQLPGWLQPVALATPLLHGVSLARAVAIGAPTVAPAWLSVTYLALLAVAGALIAVRTFTRRLTP